MAKAKSRANYPAGWRPEAKKKGLGLITISVVTPDQVTMEFQVMAEAHECVWARWAGAIIENHGTLGIDLEAIVKQAVER